MKRKSAAYRKKAPSQGESGWERALAGLLHAQTPHERFWKYLPLVLVLAFAARAAVALSGDFTLHPDEIMQYLEPAHRLVFGNGISYWEFHFGARSWLMPGLIAGILTLFDWVGLGQPLWYVDGVKLVLCAFSLLIPAGMYFFARRHFGEASARIALLAGSFWYELVGFAHKPFTEFVATALLLVLLAFCVRAQSSEDKIWKICAVAFVLVLVAAIRMQYMPLTLLLLAMIFLQTPRKLVLACATITFFIAVGVFDALTWDRGLFHSYITNIKFNLTVDYLRAGETPGHQYLWWFVLASCGLIVPCVVAALRSPRRYGFLLVLMAVVVLLHSLQLHKEYRFVFVVIPLWLMLGADVVARTGGGRWVPGSALAVFATLSCAGILNALPAQSQLYQALSGETGIVNFIRNQDPVFAAYRYLAQAPDVAGVLQADRTHYNLPGYYYLHRKIPFYDSYMAYHLIKRIDTASSFADHVVAMDSSDPLPGYRAERKFGHSQIWRREEESTPVRQWKDYTPVLADEVRHIMDRVDPDNPAPPARLGVKFAD